MVEKRIIKFDRLKISNYDRYKDEFDFKLFLMINNVPQKISKKYKNDTPEALRDKLMDEVKDEFASMSSNLSDDILENALLVMIDDYEEVEEKLVLFFKKIKDKVRDFKNNKRAEGYINFYNGMSDRARNLKLGLGAGLLAILLPVTGKNTKVRDCWLLRQAQGKIYATDGFGRSATFRACNSGDSDPNRSIAVSQ